MRRVSKSKAAALETSPRVSPKRAATKKAVADGELDEVDGSERSDPISKPIPTKNGQSKENTVEFSEENDEAESFEVESILSSRARHGKRQFKIRWKGFGPADDTWEDEEDIDSPELIAAFLKGPPDVKDSKTVTKTTKKQTKKRSSSTSSKSKSATASAKKMKLENSNEDTEWEVSKIVDYVNLKDGTRQFLVQWKGFSSKENTWEPEANLNCTELIEKFMALEKEREESTRETRTVRKQVFKYNPEVTKRSSQRYSTKKRIFYHDLE